MWIGGGLVLLAAFLRYERTATHPLLNLTMLSRREVATVLGATSIPAAAFLSAAVALLIVDSAAP